MSINNIKLNIADISLTATALGAIYKNGIWWKEIKKGFYWPIDFSSVIEEKIILSKFNIIGFQYLSTNSIANSSLKFLYINDLSTYDIKNLNSKSRNKIKQSLKHLNFNKITTYNNNEAKDALLCWNDLVSRTKWRSKMDFNQFSKYWKELISLPGHTIIGAYYNKKLIGWLVGISFNNGNCYITRYAALKDFFKYKVNNGLIYAFLMAAKSSGLKTVNFGLYIPQNPSLDNFKESMGFNLTVFPAYTYFNPIVKPFLKLFFKKKLDRITGWYTNESYTFNK